MCERRDSTQSLKDAADGLSLACVERICHLKDRSTVQFLPQASDALANLMKRVGELK